MRAFEVGTEKASFGMKGGDFGLQFLLMPGKMLPMTSCVVARSLQVMKLLDSKVLSLAFMTSCCRTCLCRLLKFHLRLFGEA